jgi:hypothetical protein
MNELVEKGLHDRRRDLGKGNLDPSREAEERWLAILDSMDDLEELESGRDRG